MIKSEAIQEPRQAAVAWTAKQASKAAAARTALNQMRRRAEDLTVRAQTRARSEIDRRRSVAADTLESLASALRPEDETARARRRALAIAGGSSLALTAALGLGVALGFMLSRRRKARAEQRAETSIRNESATPMPQVMKQDPVVAALDR